MLNEEGHLTTSGGLRRGVASWSCLCYTATDFYKTKPAFCGFQKSLVAYLAGPEGFEPPNARTKTWCLTAWRRPNNTLDATVLYHS